MYFQISLQLRKFHSLINEMKVLEFLMRHLIVIKQRTSLNHWLSPQQVSSINMIDILDGDVIILYVIINAFTA